MKITQRTALLDHLKKNKRIDNFKHPYIKSLRDEGKTVKEIAAMFKVSTITISRILSDKPRKKYDQKLTYNKEKHAEYMRRYRQSKVERMKKYWDITDHYGAAENLSDNSGAENLS